ncbi:hypothetical protein [Oricola thermophila]|uniref:Uncharacterized protein n=1 Tax=Oricola thermophila TaxID=2742145 RepID=A0A6N1VH44_9HYPH|nr:hypothetical protein [Oricola thermophila]QKV20256.1 hypothetical protein HTY61_18255 [Oricola thermophila]
MKAMIAAIALVASTASASAIEATTEQRNVIVNIAAATVIAGKCESATVNTQVVAAVMAAWQMPADSFSPGGPFEPAMIEAMQKAHDDAAAIDGPAACGVARAMFGPDGANVPNFVSFD